MFLQCNFIFKANFQISNLVLSWYIAPIIGPGQAPLLKDRDITWEVKAGVLLFLAVLKQHSWLCRSFPTKASRAQKVPVKPSNTSWTLGVQVEQGTAALVLPGAAAVGLDTNTRIFKCILHFSVNDEGISSAVASIPLLTLAELFPPCCGVNNSKV